MEMFDKLSTIFTFIYFIGASVLIFGLLIYQFQLVENEELEKEVLRMFFPGVRLSAREVQVSIKGKISNLLTLVFCKLSNVCVDL